MYFAYQQRVYGNSFILKILRQIFSSIASMDEKKKIIIFLQEIINVMMRFCEYVEVSLQYSIFYILFYVVEKSQWYYDMIVKLEFLCNVICSTKNKFSTYNFSSE